MSRGPSVLVAGAVLLVLGPACAGGGASGGGRAEPSPSTSPSPQVCRVLYSPPAGFLPTGVVRQPAARGGGVRESFVDEGGRELYLTSGIEGEFGEGAPVLGRLRVSGGARATLYGRAKSWVLVWRLDQPRCVTQTVGANGLDRAAFMKVLRQMRVMGSGGGA